VVPEVFEKNEKEGNYQGWHPMKDCAASSILMKQWLDIGGAMKGGIQKS